MIFMQKYDSQDYDDYKMLDVVYDFDTQQSGNHIIGKRVSMGNYV